MVGIPASRALGNLVAYRREGLGLDQTAFADRVGWSRATVSRIERGVRGLTHDGEVLLLAEVFGMPVEEFRASALAEPLGGSGLAQATSADVIGELRELRKEIAGLRADVRLLLQVGDVTAAGEEAARVADALIEQSRESSEQPSPAKRPPDPVRPHRSGPPPPSPHE